MSEQMRVQCPKCSKPVNYIYCPYCGADQETSSSKLTPAPSPLGGLGDIITEYDRIVDGRLDPRDAEADFVMRGSDWREIRKALSIVGTIPAEESDEEFARAVEQMNTAAPHRQGGITTAISKEADVSADAAVSHERRCDCTSYNGGPCYNCINGHHEICDNGSRVCPAARSVKLTNDKEKS